MSKSNLCIYCKSTDSEKFKGVEHVLPQGFGLFGTDTPTLPGCVCDDCNGLLGKTIDQHLTRETLEGLARYNKGILSRETRPQTRLHITLENTPEIGEFGGMKVAIDGNARKLMPVKTQYMVLNKKTGEWEYFFEENIPGIQLSEAVYGKHGADGVKGDREHKIFAQSKEEADKMIALLEENGIQFVPGEPFSTPKPLAQNGEAAVFIEGEVMPEQRRAHAKIFLNLIAYHLGCDEAMKSHWDFLRRYVRFAEGEIRYRMVDRPEVPSDDKRIIVKIQNLNGHVVGSIQFYGNETYQYILRVKATLPDEHEMGFLFIDGQKPQMI